MKKIKVALIQMRMDKNQDKNFKKALSMIDKAAKKGGKIVCLPELFSTIYFPQHTDSAYFKLAEPIPGPSTRKLSKVAKQHKIVLVAGLFEQTTDGLFHNTAVTFDTNGKITNIYRKMHIPHDPCFEEKYYFAPGDRGFKSVKTSYASIGTLICWDQWYPEAARITALQGAQIVFYPTAIGWFKNDTEAVRKELYDAWQTIQRSHAIANGIFVCATNRVGTEGKLVFCGGSFIAEPFGKVIAQGSFEKEEIVMAECNLDKIRETRLEWPFLRDRRIDAYDQIKKRFIKE